VVAPPGGGCGVAGINGTGRVQRRRCLPCAPPGGRIEEARRRVCSSALPRRRGPEHRLAAQPCAGAVRRRRGISRCTDRSAGGCADWRTLVTTRARALSGPDAVEAAPRRWASWHSRGRRWRGPSARATKRPCRLSPVPTGPLTPVRPAVPGKPLGREPRPPAPARRQEATSRVRVRAALCRCPGRLRRLGPSKGQCLLQRVVHTRWGKQRAAAGELLQLRRLGQPACQGSATGRNASKDCTHA
jgi:hypothetical protein